MFREERERPALIFIDQGQHMFFGSKRRLKSVAAAELAARIAWQITGAGDRVGGMVLDTTGHHIFRPFRTQKATGRLLARIAQSNALLSRPTQLNASADEGSQNQRLDCALNALAQLRQQRNRLFVVSDLAGPLALWRNALYRLARRHQVHVLQLLIRWMLNCLPRVFTTSVTALRACVFFWGQDITQTVQRGSLRTSSHSERDLPAPSAFATGIEHRRY